jgi:microcystin-dependent protein
MSGPFIGDIALVPFTFVPKDWLPCDGRAITAAENPTLVKVLGDRFGGDGVTTSFLPDLRGRTPLGAGEGPGLTPRSLGEAGGEAQHKITQPELPAHTHDIRNVVGRQASAPGGHVPSVGGAYAARPPKAPMAGGAVTVTGKGHTHENRQPALALQWIIAAQGTDPFPS